jgi:hypothetical protein
MTPITLEKFLVRITPNLELLLFIGTAGGLQVYHLG